MTKAICLYKSKQINACYVKSNHAKPKQMKGTHLGEFEELVLLVVLILQKEAYVLKIKSEVFDQTGRSVTMGSLHPTLSRLENKGFLSSELTGATNERGGRRKRVYHLTASGKAALNAVKTMRSNLWNQVPDFAMKIV